MKTKLQILCLCASLPFAAPATAGDLVIELKGIRSNEGSIMGGVHVRMPDVKFPAPDSSVHSFRTLAREGTVTVVFKDLPPGDYALTAFHDEDGDHELGRNALGIPTEGYAFGNDAVGFMGPPKFEDTAVTLAEGEAQVTASGTMGY